MLIQPQETTGAWGSISNLLFPEQAPRGSDFFGAGQYETIRSETTEPAGATGWTFRPTITENQSMIESKSWANLGWIGSPYEADKAIPVKVAESKQLAARVEPRQDPLGEGLDWALGTAAKAATLYDQIRQTFSPREVTVETPRAGYPEGRDIRHTNDMSERSAEVYATGKDLYEQVKGLFNIGYPQTGPQPAAPIAAPKIGIATIVILLLLFLLLRK